VVRLTTQLGRTGADGANPGTARFRVLLVGKGAPDRGGIPTFLEILQRGELAASHDLTFLNVAHSSVPQGGQATIGNLRRTLKDAFAVLRAAGGQDVVHVHSAMAPTVTVLRAALLGAAGRLRGARVVIHAHGGNIESWLTTPWRRLMLRAAMGPVDRVVAVWSAGERSLRTALPPAKVCHIGNGVVVDDFTPAEPSSRTPRILYVGLLTERKGVLDLVEASRLLVQRGAQHELWLVGGTPDEGPAAEEPVRAAAAGVAKLLGTRAPEEMAAIYGEVDVFCLPSWWEAMPLSVLEAMACGLPVVATAVGDVPRMVVEGETGRIATARSPKALADALEPLLRSAETRRAMGHAGRDRAVEHFSDVATARAVSALYAEIARPRA
jgi:D-inositol-3-phosphate glycosyltransferase